MSDWAPTGRKDTPRGRHRRWFQRLAYNNRVNLRLTYADIAAKLGVVESTVREWLKEVTA